MESIEIVYEEDSDDSVRDANYAPSESDIQSER